MNSDWLKYSNQGAVRSKPISGQLQSALSFLPEMGVSMEVFSGGQPGKGTGGARIGSTRHDHGNAADAFFYKDGQRLDWANPQHQPIFKQIVQRAKANGVTGIGAGDGYMRPGSMHIGFGNPGVWGSEGKGANAASWLNEAYHGQPGHVHGGSNTNTVAGGLAISPQAPPDTLSQGATMQPEQQQRQHMLFNNMDPARRDRLIMAMQGMTMTPNQGLMGMAQQNMADRRTTANEQKAEAKRNQTIEWLAQQPGGEKFAQAAAAGIPVNQAFNAYRQETQAANDPSVQSSTALPDMSGSVVTMRDGSQAVITAGGDRLTGQEAMDFVQRSQQAYTEQQRSVYGARQGGKLEADIDLGGDAERAKQEGKMAPTTAKEFAQNAGVIRSSIVNMDDAMAALDRGANSGIVYKMLPAVSEASASLRNSMNRLGLDVIGSVTFGALSQAEMQLAMETAVPRNLEPAALKDWLTRKRAAQVKAHQAAMEAAQHFASGGTQADYYSSIGLPAAPQLPAPGAGGFEEPAQGTLSDDDLLKKYGGN